MISGRRKTLVFGQVPRVAYQKVSNIVNVLNGLAIIRVGGVFKVRDNAAIIKCAYLLVLER